MTTVAVVRWPRQAWSVTRPVGGRMGSVGVAQLKTAPRQATASTVTPRRPGCRAKAFVDQATTESPIRSTGPFGATALSRADAGCTGSRATAARTAEHRSERTTSAGADTDPPDRPLRPHVRR